MTVEQLLETHLPSLSAEEKRKLCLYALRLEETNRLFNLTALSSPEDIVLLHFYDALTLLRTGLFQSGISVLDVGTGGGVPAFPLAVCSDATVTANDATKKKLDFVDAVAREARVCNLTTLCGRAEELGKQKEYREKYDVVVSRGVARMNILAEWCLPFVKPGGRFIAMKGSSGREELEEAKHAIETLGGRIEEVIDCPIPQVEHSHTLLVIEKIRPTDAQYPRANGRIKKKPL